MQTTTLCPGGGCASIAGPTPPSTPAICLPTFSRFLNLRKISLFSQSTGICSTYALPLGQLLTCFLFLIELPSLLQKYIQGS